MAEVQEFQPDEMDISPEEAGEETTTETVEEEEEVVVEGEEEDEEGEAAAGPDLAAKVQKLETDLYTAGREIEALRAEKTVPKEKDAPPKEEAAEVLSHEQLVGLIKEHGDNPDVMARVMTHIAESASEKAASKKADETVKDVNYRQWYSEHKKVNDGVVGTYYQSSPQLKGEVGQAVKNFGLENHPLGELFVIATMEMANKEKVKEDAESTRTEKLKTQKGLEKTRPGGEKKGAPKLTKEQLQVARDLEVDPKTYAKFLGSDSATVT